MGKIVIDGKLIFIDESVINIFPHPKRKRKRRVKK